MPTHALFRDDAYLTDCEARVVSVSASGIELDRTVFYPLSGGQAADSGTLTLVDGTTLDISEARKASYEGATPDDVWHVPAPGQEAACARIREGEPVMAQIDWRRRYRHMRFHTATHVLCAVVRQLVDGCSITTDYARMDFAMTELLDRAAIEEGLRQKVNEGHLVHSRWITDEEMLANPQFVKSMSVRPPMGFGRVRLLQVDDVDLQACGGTHVKNTAEIGDVRITKVEKKSARTRRVVLGLGDG